jgi:hypothetical protein
MRSATSSQTPSRLSIPSWHAFALAAAFWAALFACFTVTAKADPFEIVEVHGGLTKNPEGDPATQAGSHPYAGNAFIRVASHMGIDPLTEGEFEYPNGNFKDVITTLPPGLVGTPLATPQCSRAVFNEALPTDPSKCPDESAVGWAKIKPNWAPYELFGPIYNLKPAHGQPALFGFRISSATVYLSAGLKTGPEPSVTISSIESSQGLPILYTEVTLWGTPADPSHDAWRGNCLIQKGPTGDLCEGSKELKPMFATPTSCSGPIETTLKSNSWLEPQSWTEMSFLSEDREGNPVGVDDCETLAFDPDLQTAMEPKSAASPASLDVDFTVPQNDSPEGRVTAHVKKAVVEFPVGVALNSASADGLSACSLEQVALEVSAPTECPASSRIGTVEVTTPLLEGPLDGSLYLAEQNRNPFDSMYAVYLVIDDPAKGIYVKVPGRVDVDPQTGQIKTTFDNNPQIPFDHLTMSFAGGPRSPLRTPEKCGTYTTNYTLTAWNGKTVTSSDSFTIDRNCGKENQFTPGFSAGTENPAGGHYSPFAMRVTREDGQQNVAALDVNLPKGLVAKLAGVPLCADADAGSGNCPAASQIGTTTVGSGAGTNPLYVPQPGKAPTALYLAGPYKGGPYSVVAKVPAQAGPFDLGVVSVRSAIHVDPATAQVSVNSDPLPQILEGIPVAYRDIRVEVNRPEFTLNPTSCDPTAVNGTIASAIGTRAAVSSRFQAGDCASLKFKPQLALSLKGGTKRSQFPALTAVLTTPKGSNANIARTSVALPRSEFLEQSHIRTVCTRVQYRADNCPAAAIYGYAEAKTPLLDEPLKGPVYLRSSDELLPNLVAALKGPIEIDLVGSIDSIRGGIRTTFKAVPDAPVSRFVLRMQGGKKGLLVNSRDVCNATYRATVKMDGQNGKAYDTRPVLRHAGCKTKSGKGAKHGAGR